MVKIFLLLLILSCCWFTGSTQTTADTSAIFTGKPDVLPAYKGGRPAWIKFLTRHLNAEVPTDNGAPRGTYTVVVSFIVDEKGELSDLKIDKDAGYGTGAEGIRIIKLSEGYLPATVNGKPVKYRHKESFTFMVS